MWHWGPMCVCMYLCVHISLTQNNPFAQHPLFANFLMTVMVFICRIWANCLNLTEPYTDISEWGWQINAAGEVNPLWTTLPKASQACKELKHCKCKNGCANTSCTCKAYALPCTELCLCRGFCEWEEACGTMMVKISSLKHNFILRLYLVNIMVR